MECPCTFVTHIRDFVGRVSSQSLKVNMNLTPGTYLPVIVCPGTSTTRPVTRRDTVQHQRRSLRPKGDRVKQNDLPVPTKRVPLNVFFRVKYFANPVCSNTETVHSFGTVG